jgi:trk system potassium uptake protein
LKYSGHIPLLISLLAILAIFYDYGFDQEPEVRRYLNWIYLLAIAGGLGSIAARYVLIKKHPALRMWPVDFLICLFLALVIAGAAGIEFANIFDHPLFLYTGVLLVFLREFSALGSIRRIEYLNPAQLFVVSYFVMICFGTLLLMLPNATYADITFTDALFTSTSAFCITGLVVVDTGTYFTPFGQVIILILIQLGGLGIMTFTGFFSYIFTGGSTFGNQLMLKDMTSSDRIAEVFGIVKMIILFTIIIEAAGALFIYFSIDNQVIRPVEDRIFFSIFHAVSGFCNAGFTTITDGLYNPEFRHNYNLHLVISFLFIIGGLGFSLFYNLVRYMRHYLLNRILKSRALHVPWVISMNTRIVVITTLILLAGGTFFFYILEYDNALASHEGAGKVITAFFGAATPRSAGFNTVDTSALLLPTLLLVMLLMWIGAGPGSTGAGIKVTTFAVAVMNVISLSRGKDRIEVFGREISGSSVRRAFAVILLSFVMIGVSTFLIVALEPGLDLLPVAFECFSAYSTTGLSMGITGDLGDLSKVIITFNMFTGRIGMLVVILALLRKVKHLNYRFPEETILIN